MIVVGVDGCQGRWEAATIDIGEELPKLQSLESYCLFEEIVDVSDPEAVIAVDIPIGLVECVRRADTEARVVLYKRKSSVFPAPDPRVVEMDDYWEANRIMRELCGKGISKQSFALFPKVAEVNKVILRRDPKQCRIFEIHPEICFWALNGEVEMQYPKRETPGFEERSSLLRNWIKVEWLTNREKASKQALGAQSDDVLDAISAAWTATRWAENCVKRFSVTPERGTNKLRAEIVYLPRSNVPHRPD